jgi:hypothetical protein
MTESAPLEPNGDRTFFASFVTRRRETKRKAREKCCIVIYVCGGVQVLRRELLSLVCTFTKEGVYHRELVAPALVEEGVERR